MPASLSPDWNRAQTETQRFGSLLPTLGALPIVQRKLVAEILVIRLFLLLESSIRSVALKLLCGAIYLDGSAPQRLVRATSISQAESLMARFSGHKNRRLRWTRAKEIRANAQHTLAATDPFFATIGRHAAFLTEIRYVRNHIAHGNERTRSNFRKVVRSYYGAIKKGTTPGLLLLTTAFGSPTVIETYVRTSRIFIRELVSA